MSETNSGVPQLLRSVLYMPGNNTRAMEKAQTLGADAIIMDLEDSVAPEEKQLARQNIVTALSEYDYGERLIVVRTNGLDTQYFADDIQVIATSGADAVLVPKVSTVDDVEQANVAMDRAGAEAMLGLWVMMETPLAILNAHAIAACASRANARLRALVIGSNDLARLTHVDVAADRTAMQSWFSACVLAARAYGLSVLDGPCNDFSDNDRLGVECAEGLRLGMDGKTLIHPTQIELTNQLYSPGADQIAWAEQVLEAFAQPGNDKVNVVAVNGEMVERLHIEIAQRILSSKV